MVNRVIDRWAYRNDNCDAMCWVTVCWVAGSTESCKLAYRLHVDRTPAAGKADRVPMPWYTVADYDNWADLAKACPAAIIGEGVYATSLIGRGELREVDVLRMVKPEIDELRDATNDARTPFEVLLSAGAKPKQNNYH